MNTNEQLDFILKSLRGKPKVAYTIDNLLLFTENKIAEDVLISRCRYLSKEGYLDATIKETYFKINAKGEHFVDSNSSFDIKSDIQRGHNISNSNVVIGNNYGDQSLLRNNVDNTQYATNENPMPANRLMANLFKSRFSKFIGSLILGLLTAYIIYRLGWNK